MLVLIFCQKRNFKGIFLVLAEKLPVFPVSFFKVTRNFFSLKFFPQNKKKLTQKQKFLKIIIPKKDFRT